MAWTVDGPPKERPAGLYAWLWDHAGAPEPAFGAPELNIGWLDADHEYPCEATDEDFRDMLAQLCLTTRYHLWRSARPCPLCGEMPSSLLAAEIRIAGDGVVYASPNLVHHYVVQHAYRPPEGFIAGVMLSGGRQASSIPGTRREIPVELLQYRHIDVGSLRAEVRLLISNWGDAGEMRDVSIEMIGDNFRVDVVLGPEVPFAPLRRHWEIPRNAVLNVEQGAYGIWSMFLDALNIRNEELFRPGKPSIFRQK